MNRAFGNVVVMVLVAVCLVSQAQGLDAARDLKQMIGYTIVDASWLSVVQRDEIGQKYLKLGDGNVFKVQFLLLDPLPMTDVIVFAKPPSKEIVETFGDKLLDYLL